MFAFLGWTFDFSGSGLLGFIKDAVVILHPHAAESWLLGAGLGASGIGGLVAGALADRFGKRTVLSAHGARLFTWIVDLRAGAERDRVLRGSADARDRHRRRVGDWPWNVGGGRGSPDAWPRGGSPASRRTLRRGYCGAGRLPGSAAGRMAGGAGRGPASPRCWPSARASGASPGSALGCAHAPHRRAARRSPRSRASPPLPGRLAAGAFKLQLLELLHLAPHVSQPRDAPECWALPHVDGDGPGRTAGGTSNFGAISDRLGRRPAFALYSLLTAAAVGTLAAKWDVLLLHPPGRKLAAYAENFEVKTGWHAAGCSPVGHMARLTLDVTCPNFGIHEDSPISDRERQVFQGIHEVKDGFAWVSEKPGWGIEIDEAAAAKMPLPTEGDRKQRLGMDLTCPGFDEEFTGPSVSSVRQRRRRMHVISIRRR